MLQHFSSFSLTLDAVRHSFRPETFPPPAPPSRDEIILQRHLREQEFRTANFAVIAYRRLSESEHDEDTRNDMAHFEGLTKGAETLFARLRLNPKMKKVLRTELVAGATRCLRSKKAATTWIAIVEFDAVANKKVRPMAELIEAMRTWSNN